jgi:hypothetical protein
MGKSVAQIEQLEQFQRGNLKSAMSKGFGKLHDGIRQIRSAADGIGITDTAIENFIIIDTVLLKALRAIRLEYGISYNGPIQEPNRKEKGKTE